MKILVIVTHYDDEVLSCGGFIYQNSKKHKIDIVAITDKYNWSMKFIQVCKGLRAHKSIPLKIPLWTDKKTKVLNFFTLDTLQKRFLEHNIKFSDYDLILTHGKDGDIDFHKHHIHTYKLICDLSDTENLMHFVAFPRKGVKETHQLYKWIKERNHWYNEIMVGIIPNELLEKSNFIYKLMPDTVKIKQKLFGVYFKGKTNYVAIDYPVELFHIEGDIKL